MNHQTKLLIDSEMVGVSEAFYGGNKGSGYGKDLSMYALEDYTVPRHIMIAH